MTVVSPFTLKYLDTIISEYFMYGSLYNNQSTVFWDPSRQFNPYNMSWKFNIINEAPLTYDVWNVYFMGHESTEGAAAWGASTLWDKILEINLNAICPYDQGITHVRDVTVGFCEYLYYKKLIPNNLRMSPSFYDAKTGFGYQADLQCGFSEDNITYQ